LTQVNLILKKDCTAQFTPRHHTAERQCGLQSAYVCTKSLAPCKGFAKLAELGEDIAGRADLQAMTD
jgi:hypothetical protein